MGRLLTWLPLILMLAIGLWLLSGWDESKDSTVGPDASEPIGQEDNRIANAIKSGLR